VGVKIALEYVTLFGNSVRMRRESSTGGSTKDHGFQVSLDVLIQNAALDSGDAGLLPAAFGGSKEIRGVAARPTALHRSVIRLGPPDRPMDLVKQGAFDASVRCHGFGQVRKSTNHWLIGRELRANRLIPALAKRFERCGLLGWQRTRGIKGRLLCQVVLRVVVIHRGKTLLIVL
jgi:hypothetical protein